MNDETVLVAQLKAASETILGMDYQMFSCTVGAFSESLHGFLALKPKEQKEFLLNYFCDTNVDWGSVREYVQEKVLDVAERKKELDAAIDRIDKNLSEIDYPSYQIKLEDLKYKLHVEEQEYELTKASSETMRTEYKEALSTQSYLSAEIERRETIKDSIKEKEKALASLKSAITANVKAQEAYITLSGYDYRIKTMDNKLGALQATIQQTKASISEYDKNGGKCPILKAECPHTVGLKEFYLQSKETLVKSEVKMSCIEENRRYALEERRAASTLASKHKDLVNSKAIVERDLKELQQKEHTLSDLLEGFLAIQQEVKFLESSLNTNRIETLVNSIAATKTSIDTVKGILLGYEMALAEKRTKDEELMKIETEFKELSTVAKLVSPKGLPHILLNEVLLLLESYTNRYLSFVDMSVMVSGYSELKSLEEFCHNDGTKFNKNDTMCRTCGAVRENKVDETINIISKDSGVEWFRESSGGKALIALAVRLAIFKLAKSKKADADFLILDEVFTNLDSENKGKALEMLRFAMTDLGLKQIL
ncbi:MAG: hypothetical protein EOL98_14910, partial [Negativicutes bacterium]|nr:hypothetical protein [Negativicutes bacterium]